MKRIFNTTGTLNTRDLYPIGEHHTLKSRAAIWTGERRRPKRGEWYLSGAIIEAYQTPSDMPDEHPIAKIVRVAPLAAQFKIEDCNQ